MNKELNIVTILKNAPKGTKLWSSACGICEFQQIVKYTDYPIVCKTLDKYGQIINIEFTKEGKRDTIYSNGQCVLFPSETNHDWSTFVAPKDHKEFKPFEKVLVNKNNSSHIWVAGLYSHYDAINNIHFIIGAECTWWAEDNEIIPYEGNEDKLGLQERGN